MERQKYKQSWDTRAWLIGTVGGIAGGLLAGSVIYTILLHWSNNFTASVSTDSRIANDLCYFFTAIIVLVLPGFLSGLARRLTFLWGLLPLCLAYISSQAENWFRDETRVTPKDFAESMAMLTGCLLISSGPVSLIRWLRVRAARRHQAVLNSYQAMRETASVPQEGVWPPPPDYQA